MSDQLPVAEIFTSIQGEGQWAGTLMTFVRLAGCTVGKPYSAEDRSDMGLQIYQERCTDWHGDHFACDTDYRVKTRMTVEEIVAHSEVKAARFVLLTGGEPLMHQEINRLISILLSSGKRVHIESSGTIKPGQWMWTEACWLSVSPKKGCLDESLKAAKEIKVLVGGDFDDSAFQEKFQMYFSKVWVQPVNGLEELDHENFAACTSLVHRFPQIRLSTQLHKVWGVR